MRLILTHEQADFDALAALYAASLVDGGLPVLPRRSNRNVRAFLTIYGQEFPFVDPRDLPQEAIEAITLVDTQSLVTLKGMGHATQIKVFDHHPLRTTTKSLAEKKFPENWSFVALELGATTTFFVEQLQERAEALSPIQASLLLLGIYEDTGTLTYSRTTARDVHAVGWLLEQGATLGMVADFLNPPLNAEQRELYDRLVAGIENIDIHGHRIMVASGEALNVSDEISTLAHKLRDLFEPDALFLLVQTVEGVRIVARSGTDQIDVAAVTAHFGGGGHNRAAAALVKPPAREEEAGGLLAQMRDKLLAVLPQHVRPAVTVAQLMSRRPHAIAPETRAQDAASLMSRYGYEGFPVVRDGKVLGLLTRRAVDRAINHRLNLPVSSLMEAGSVVVFPADSIQRLQAVMAESGWGQVPVVDPQTQKMIGIVTRTDLLKSLSRRRNRSWQQTNLAGKLESSLSKSRLGLIHKVADLAAAANLPLYIVGGFVRDLLLGEPGLDYDIVVEGDAIALGKELVAKFGGRLTTHTRFNTAKWFLKESVFQEADLPEFLDLISARHEFYEHPSALPKVEHGSIKLDLHRRDFTINTLALRLDGRHFGELHDHYGGVADLHRGYVRVLHSLSFVDDPTRMLRAVRYEQRYTFQIEQRTAQLMDESLLHVAGLSEERVRHELDMILVEPKAVEMLARLDELRLLKAISGELPWNEGIKTRLAGCLAALQGAERLFEGIDASDRVDLLYCLWLLDLPLAAIAMLQTRLAFPVHTYKAIRAAAELLRDAPGCAGANPSKWTERLDGVPLLAIQAVFMVSGEEALETYARRWRFIHAYITGETLKARGLTPGPAFRNILSTLRNAWLDGLVSTREEEEHLLLELLK